MSSKAKKAASTINDYVDYQPKDLIWAKMKGFTPWPSMVVEPPLDMIHANRRPETKCVFFFGSRNFAWIEISKLKPFDGPWRAEMSRGGTKPSASFRTAIKDIEAYIENPLEVDAEINELIANKNASAPDFDRIRDGLENEEEDAAVSGIDNGDVQANETLINKTPKRTPKPKVSGAASTKARSTVGSKTPTKRRRSSQGNSSTKRKRSSLPARDDASDSPNDRRRILNAEALATLGFATRRNPNSNALLHRPIVSRPDPQTVDMSHRSTVLAERAITPSELTFGFMGLGIMGAAIVKDLICTGHNVVVWNRTAAKCEPFVEAGAKFAATPMDVVELCDIIFCCVSDPRACKDLVFGNCGVLNIKDLNQKAYVEMTTIDPESSLDIAEGIKQNNGRYLEVQINGTRQEAEDGMLIVLAGGDRTVFEDCHSCFKTIAKNTFFLGADIGNACKVNLILQTIVGTSLVGLAEALALADRFSISLKDIIDIFELTSMKSPLLIAKGKEMAKGEFNPDHPLSHMQKDLRLVLGMAENLDQAMPLTATANEVFKHTKRLGYGEHDSSAVFVRSRF